MNAGSASDSNERVWIMSLPSPFFERAQVGGDTLLFHPVDKLDKAPHLEVTADVLDVVVLKDMLPKLIEGPNIVTSRGSLGDARATG